MPRINLLTKYYCPVMCHFWKLDKKSWTMKIVQSQMKWSRLAFTPQKIYLLAKCSHDSDSVYKSYWENGLKCKKKYCKFYKNHSSIKTSLRTYCTADWQLALWMNFHTKWWSFMYLFWKMTISHNFNTSQWTMKMKSNGL